MYNFFEAANVFQITKAKERGKGEKRSASPVLLARRCCHGKLKRPWALPRAGRHHLSTNQRLRVLPGSVLHEAARNGQSLSRARSLELPPRASRRNALSSLA